MELFLKRDEHSPNLYAKLVDITDEEWELLRKTDTTKAFLWEPETQEAFKDGRKYRLLGMFGGGILGLIVGAATLSVLAFLVITLFGIFLLPQILAGQFRKVVTVADLLQGRNIHCKNMDELVFKEASIRDRLPKYRNYLERMKTSVDGERIRIEPE